MATYKLPRRLTVGGGRQPAEQFGGSRIMSTRWRPDYDHPIGRKVRRFYIPGTHGVGPEVGIDIVTGETISLPNPVTVDPNNHTISYEISAGADMVKGAPLNLPGETWTVYMRCRSSVVDANGYYFSVEDEATGDWVALGPNNVSSTFYLKIYTNNYTPGTGTTVLNTALVNFALSWDGTQFICYMDGNEEYRVTPSGTSWIPNLETLYIGGPGPNSLSTTQSAASYIHYAGLFDLLSDDEIRIMRYQPWEWLVAETPLHSVYMPPTDSPNLETGLLAQWDVNTRNRTDNDLYDHVNNNLVTSVGSPTVETSQTWDGLNYNGTSQYSVLDMTPISGTLPNGDFTMACRVWLDGPGTDYETLFAFHKSTEEFARVGMFTGISENTGLSYVDDDVVTRSQTFLNVTEDISVAPVTCVVMRQNGVLRTFVNGVEGANASVDPAWSDTTYDILEIGSSNGAGTRKWYLDGTIYWAAVWNRALSSRELDLFEGVENPFLLDITRGLKGQWDVNTRGRSDNMLYDHVNSNLETATNGSTLVAGGLERDGVNFNGSSQYVARNPLPTNISGSITNDEFTMAVRVKPDNPPPAGFCHVFALLDGGNGNRADILLHGWSGRYYASNAIGTTTSCYMDSGNDDAIANFTAPDVVIFRRMGNHYELWKDGQCISVRDVDIGTAPTFNRLSFAARADGDIGSNAWYYDGTIYWAAIWDRAVTDAEIQFLTTYENPFLPQITSVSDPTVESGQQLIVYGRNFGSSQGTSTVDIDGVTQTVSEWTEREIIIPSVDLTGLPAGAANVRVDVN